MDAKLTENVNFVGGTGKDFVLKFIKLTLYIHTNHISCVIYALCLEKKIRKRNEKISRDCPMLPSNGI